jgi:hypothetical protein
MLNGEQRLRRQFGHQLIDIWIKDGWIVFAEVWTGVAFWSSR